MYPKSGGIISPISYKISRWGHDQYSCGSHSYLRTSSSPSDYDVLAKPIDDCLFFAGEATNGEFPSSAHGALLSGRREALRIAMYHATRIGIS
mmetsp:Transcript_13891/g.17234  ORF Transcript_13891/g.17234 Transcript_13891/m.17234 type:complete len:93 (-) Transcript_13891:775-1053(-)